MHSTTSNRQNTISAAFSDRGLLKDPDVQQAILQPSRISDKGRIRVAEPGENGWRVNAWNQTSGAAVFRAATT